jgi:cell wall-associated NlpC family hydrolase
MRIFNKKTLIPFLTIFSLFIVFSRCSFRSEPDKVWNLRSKVVGLTLSLIGFPYKYGGKDIQGFDCSGFVSYIYGCYGLTMPRTAKKQGKLKPRIRLSQARPGDLMVFKLPNGWHTGIMVDRDTFVHSPSRGGRVRKESLNNYWTSRLKWVIRIIEDS